VRWAIFNLLITARFPSIPYHNPTRAFFTIPDRLLLSVERLFIRFCNNLMAFIIFLKDISEFSIFLMNSNLDRCFLENLNRPRLLILSFLRFNDSSFDLFFLLASLYRNVFYISKISFFFCNSFQYFSLAGCIFILLMRFCSIFSRYSYRISSFLFVDSCGPKNIFCDFNGRLLTFSYRGSVA
jgi:hypothetical protein